MVGAISGVKAAIYDYPSCKPGCLVNNGGCPGGTPCHQVDGRIYREAGQCYRAIGGCYGCLGNAADHPDALTPVQCQAPDQNGVSGDYTLGEVVDVDQGCLSFCPNQRCKKPIHTTLLMPGVSERKSRTARALFQHMASETGGKFREPFPPRESL